MNFRLHVLVDPAQVALDQIGTFCEALATGGATIVQLRGKRASGRELVTFGAVLRRETRRTGLGLIVNDRVDIALAIEADGVHVGQDDIPVPLVRRLAPHLVVGLSVGNHQELVVARAHRPDYIGMGPVYPTASKADAGPALGIEGFKTLRAEAAEVAPVVAIGGIGVDNVMAVWQAGADGIAVISAVMNADNKAEACRRLVEHYSSRETLSK